ncbi:acyltransferase [Flavobacterium luteum]|uniref:Acyltransferase n=1 Tax=Flavobacterium luteum TaxID=2026654 RepID=A0A7J5AE21_9FLAO|nr:acyltransferase [Flavobacterium luteum]KAB1155785.1 acyltransferase [Flavobacterium luteum]
MQYLFIYLLKILKRIQVYILRPFDWVISFFILYANGCKFRSFKSIGIPKINISLGGKCFIGNNFRMNNRESSNPIGRFYACSIIVGKNGKLIIGNNVGMSSSAIVCQDTIEIGNDVNIGGNVVIYDTNFHSLDYLKRQNHEADIIDVKTRPVKIGNNVFIGAHTTILKGVTIGDNSIVGACSLVTKDISSNEVWGGNPAKFIKII